MSSKAVLRNWALSARLLFCNSFVCKVPSHTFRLTFYRQFMGQQIGPRSSVHMGAYIDAVGGLTVGARSTVNRNCRIDTRGGVVIGSDVTIASEVTVLTADHNVNSPTFEGRQRSVTIGDHAFVGTRAMILPGVSIGTGAVVAAGAVVTRDVVAYTIVAGVPARVVGTRNADLRYSGEYRRPLF